MKNEVPETKVDAADVRFNKEHTVKIAAPIEKILTEAQKTKLRVDSPELATVLREKDEKKDESKPLNTMAA